MNNQNLQFRFYDSNASGTADCAVLPTAIEAAEDEVDWLDETQIMAGLRESVRTGRPAAEIFRAMRRK